MTSASVDLPPPDGPQMPVKLPRAMSSETPAKRRPVRAGIGEADILDDDPVGKLCGGAGGQGLFGREVILRRARRAAGQRGRRGLADRLHHALAHGFALAHALQGRGEARHRRCHPQAGETHHREARQRAGHAAGRGREIDRGDDDAGGEYQLVHGARDLFERAGAPVHQREAGRRAVVARDHPVLQAAEPDVDQAAEPVQHGLAHLALGFDALPPEFHRKPPRQAEEQRRAGAEEGACDEDDDRIDDEHQRDQHRREGGDVGQRLQRQVEAVAEHQADGFEDLLRHQQPPPHVMLVVGVQIPIKHPRRDGGIALHGEAHEEEVRQEAGGVLEGEYRDQDQAGDGGIADASGPAGKRME